MEENQVMKLKKKREILRRIVEEVCLKIDELLGSTVNKESAEQEFNLINGKVVFLKKKWHDLRELDMRLEEEVSLAELEEEILDVAKFEELVTTTLSTAELRIKLHESKGIEVMSNSQNRNKLSTNSGNSKTVRLPKLEFPKFSGELTQWASWWERYSTSIHENEELPIIDKFNYLRSFVTGAAESAISGIPVTELNYQTAVQKLTERFGKHEAVTRAHLRKLLNLEKLKNGSLKELRHLHDELSNNMASLNSLGVNKDNYEPLLFAKVKDLLTRDLSKDFRLSRRGSTLDELMKFLINEIEAREEDGCTLDPKENERNLKSGAVKPMNPRNPVSSLAALSVDVESKKPFCIFCGENSHWAEDCTKDFTVQQRKLILSKKGRCFRCFRGRHLAKDCRMKNQQCSKCKGRHHSLMCDAKKDSDNSVSATNTPPSPIPASTATMSSVVIPNSVFLLQTFQAKLQSNGHCFLGCCFLDGGGMRSFILKETSRKLALPVVGYEQITVNAFGGKTTSEICRRVKLTLESNWDGESLDVELLETEQICSNLLSFPTRKVQDFLEMRNLNLADPPCILNCAEEAIIHVLIGVDNYWSVVKPDVQRISDNLCALNTIFGWVVSGCVTNCDLNRQPIAANNITVMKMAVESSPANGSEFLEQFWKLEHLGIEQPTNCGEKREASALGPPVLKEGRFEVKLPWLPHKRELLADNYPVALRRLGSLQSKLRKNSNLEKGYVNVLHEYLDAGIIEEVCEGEYYKPSVYYMPHKAVVKEDRLTTRVRIVFDASSHEKEELSLNACLWQGPDLYHDLVEMLIRFRENSTAVIADIQKAFLQISVNEADRDYLRFLWCDPPFDQNVKIFRFKRVVFGVTCSPALLTSTLLHLIKEFQLLYPETTELLTESLYVDDLVTSVDGPKKASDLKEEVTSIMAKGKFVMHKWMSNDKDLREIWKHAEGCNEIDGSATKVLGLVWDYESDCCSVAPIQRDVFGKTTKRKIIQTAAKLYDPLGLLAPFVLRAKLIMQALWKCKLDWDDPVSPEILTLWNKWVDGLQEIPLVTVPRWVGIKNSDKMQVDLHLFVDASESAYAAVAYLRIEHNSDVSVHFLLCKTRVAPLKELTLPRLELMAALLGARLYCTIIRSLRCKINQIYFWTDSLIALSWIRGNADRWKEFVRNRVLEIQKTCDPKNWRHCPGNVNPADIPSRGASPKELIKWVSGPDWLKESENYWPKSEDISSLEMQMYMEVALPSQTKSKFEEPLINAEEYSSYHKLVRVTAWLFRVFLQKLNSSVKGEPLTSEEIERADHYWIKKMQSDCFPKELSCLAKGQEFHKNSVLKKFSCEIDLDGLLRIKSRIHNIDLNEDLRNPIILSAVHPYGKLLIASIHKRLWHAGVRDTLTELRERFWPLKGRQQTKKIINSCLNCKKLKALPISNPIGGLPTDRTTFKPAFEITGLDFAGPLLAKIEGSTDHKKVYIALFTCAVTRAIHLELVSDMSTNAFLLSLRRFMSRRGICRVIYSDNALTFKRTDKELKKLFEVSKEKPIRDYTSNLKITWKYSVEKAPWWGGFWERMVQTVKNALRRSLGRSLLGFEELSTILTEIEAVINSRPLTQNTGLPNDEGPLTPAHFLTGKRLTVLPAPAKERIGIGASNVGQLKRKLRIREQVISHACNRWRNEYLNLLRSAHQGSKGNNSLKVGDMVLLNKENCPRHKWPLARILSLETGRDGCPRSGVLKFGNGSVLRRPTALMIPLELSE